MLQRYECTSLADEFPLSSVHTEAFVVCQKYSPPEGLQPVDLEACLSGEQAAEPAPPWIPFVACGDLTYDADQSYDLGGDYVRREPVQV